MTIHQQRIDFGTGRYKDLVRVGEQRALRLAMMEPQTKASGGLIRKAAGWLGRQRVSRGRDLVPAHGKGGAG